MEITDPSDITTLEGLNQLQNVYFLKIPHFCITNQVILIERFHFSRNIQGPGQAHAAAWLDRKG